MFLTKVYHLSTFCWTFERDGVCGIRLLSVSIPLKFWGRILAKGMTGIWYLDLKLMEISSKESLSGRSHSGIYANNLKI